MTKAHCDMLIIFLYFPPRVKGPQGAYEQCANSLLKWVSEVMDRCRHRSFPMIFTDHNDEIGLQHVENEWKYVETPTAGSQDAGREGHVGYEFKNLMNLYHMSIANTFYERGPNGTTSRIDFVALPSEAMKFVESVNVMHRAGKAAGHSHKGTERSFSGTHSLEVQDDDWSAALN